MLRIEAEIWLDVPPVSALEARRANVLDGRTGWVGDAGVEKREKGIESWCLTGGRVRGKAMYHMVRGKDSIET